MKNLKFLLFALTFFFISCEKDKFEGPMLDNPNVEIEILQPLEVLGSTDFSNNQNTYFKASFTKQVDWKIKIKGLFSSSVKIISGKSDFIDQSNSLWDGSPTKIPFFLAEEDCLVELSFEFPDTSIVKSSIDINIQSPKLYNVENTVLLTKVALIQILQDFLMPAPQEWEILQLVELDKGLNFCSNSVHVIGIG